MSDKFKLPSQALRLGARLAPQCFGTKFQTDRGQIVASCALGAIHQAIDPDLANSDFNSDTPAVERFPGLEQTAVTCPVCDSKGYGLTNAVFVITHLNDYHRWTREQIASWLETKGL